MLEESPTTIEKKPFGYIYLITNTINDTKYVGQTTHSIKKRWKSHVGNARRGHSRTLLTDAIANDGPRSFIYEQLATANSREELDELERSFIAQHNTLYPNGYNMKDGGLNGRRVPGIKTESEVSLGDLSLSGLEQIIDICRKKGIQSLKLNNGVEFTLREEAPPSLYKRKKASEVTSDEIKTEGSFNDEDILFWSSQGIEGIQ